MERIRGNMLYPTACFYSLSLAWREHGASLGGGMRFSSTLLVTATMEDVIGSVCQFVHFCLLAGLFNRLWQDLNEYFIKATVGLGSNR